jgi:hypothetical protein
VACTGGVLGAVYDSFLSALAAEFPPIKKKDNLDLQLSSSPLSVPSPPAAHSGGLSTKGGKGRVTIASGTTSSAAKSAKQPTSNNASTSSSSKIFRSIPLDAILQALCHFLPAVQICYNHVEQLALTSLQKHDYGDLKPLQKRKNNLHTHMEALKTNSKNPSCEIVTLRKFPRLDL